MDTMAFVNNIKLAFVFAQRELKERYVGTVFGMFWFFFYPVITIFIYTVIFSDFMQMRIGIQDSHYGYSLYLIPGLLSWNFFVAMITRFTNILYEKAPIFKKVPVPIYIFFLASFLSESLLYFISMGFGVLFALFFGNMTFVDIVLLSGFMILFALFTFFLSVVIALFTPFFKDLKEVVSVVLQLWFWITPIIYLKEMLASKLPFLLEINLVYYFIEPMQKIFLSQMSFCCFEGSLLIVTIFAMVALYFYKTLVNEIKDIV